MAAKKRASASKMPARGPKVPVAQVLVAPPVAAARAAIRSRRQATGSNDVSQADVDVAAEALIRARLRPYARLITAVTGGSLSTVGPMFDDWWERFALRGVDPHSPTLDMSAKVAVHARLLVAQFEAALREQVRDVPDPTRALVAAAEIGQHQALKSTVTALTAERDRLQDRLAALTYKLSELETQLGLQSAARADHVSQLVQATQGLEQVLARALAGEKAAVKEESTVAELAKQVKQLTHVLMRGKPGSRVVRKKQQREKPERKSSGRRSVVVRKRTQRVRQRAVKKRRR